VNIHEYQAKELLRAEGVPIPPGEVATTPDEAAAIARQYGGTVVVKAQVHAGGRGKAGGVKLAKTADEAKDVASRILGMQIKGITVQRVLVTPAADIATEAYVGIILDRASKKPVFMVSPAGGIDIEEVAAKTPEKILKLPVDTRYGLQPYQAMELGFFLFDDVKRVRAAAKIMQALYTAFMKNGCSLAEINPLVVTPGGDVVALDAKMVIDDNELDRHSDVAALRDESAEAPSEVQARNANLTFIKLDGNGGSSNPEKVVNALKIITADPNVKAILFNIFGGITRTDDVANGIVTATKANPLTVPIVIRLTGTNEEIAMKILQDNGFSASSDMDEAVQRAVELARGGRAA